MCKITNSIQNCWLFDSTLLNPQMPYNKNFSLPVTQNYILRFIFDFCFLKILYSFSLTSHSNIIIQVSTTATAIIMTPTISSISWFISIIYIAPFVPPFDLPHCSQHKQNDEKPITSCHSLHETLQEEIISINKLLSVTFDHISYYLRLVHICSSHIGLHPISRAC